MGLKRSQAEIPLTDEAAQGRDSYHTEGGKGEGQHREGHLPADSVHFADVLFTCLYENSPGAEKEGDFHVGVIGDMKDRAG